MLSDSSLSAVVLATVVVVVGVMCGVHAVEGVCSKELWFDAVKSADVPTISRCLKHHPEVVNMVDELGCTGLVVAAGNGNFGVVDLLAQEPFVDVNKACRSGNTALHTVAKSGHVDVAKTLLARGAMYDAKNIQNETPLSLAAAHGHISIIALFYSLNMETLQASWTGNELMWAAAHNNLGEAKSLIARVDNAAEQDHMGQTALHWAARSGALDTFNFLITQGHSINDQSSNGWTPTFYAAYFGQVHILQRIVELGGNFNEKDKLGWTPVMWAAAGGDPSAIEFIKDNGGDVHKQENHGWTPLMMAVASNKIAASKYLLSHDGNWRATNSKGESARDIARRLQEKDIFHLLNKLHHIASHTDRDHTDL
eukprot:m.2231 g.2231  ORF g.2231 m.2231 type:complete len:368 (+) comp1740_c0_seq1:54-1157(+)